MGEGVRPPDTLHAMVFLQIFMAFVQFMLAPWYLLVTFDPASISEYMPNEQAPSALLIVRFIAAALVWVPIIYLSWKRKGPGALASLVYSVALLVIVPLAIMSGSGRPDFSDLIIFPLDISLVTLSAFEVWKMSGRGRRAIASGN